MRPISFEINEVLRTLSKSPTFTSLNKIYRNWHNIVDQKYLKYCYPNKVFIDYEKKHGKLLITSNNPATSFYLNNNKDYIIAKINTYFGYNSIVDIRIQDVPINIRKEEYTKKQKKELTQEEMDFINSFNEEDKLQKALKKLVYNCYCYREN